MCQDSDYAKYLQDTDQLRLRVLKVKAQLMRLGYDTRKYAPIEQEILELYPELNSVQTGKKLRANWYLIQADLELVSALENFVNAKKEAVGLPQG